MAPDSPEYVPIANPNPDYYTVDEHGVKTEITRAQYKEHRRKFTTINRQTVPTCGHKFQPGVTPRHSNCDSCWFAFFQTHGELTQACDEVHSKFGLPGIVQLRGKKFAKNFAAFMSTLAAWKAASEKENNEQSDGSVGGSSPSVETEPQPGEAVGAGGVEEQGSLFQV